MSDKWAKGNNDEVSIRTVYEKFAKTNSTAEQEALCYSAIDEIDPNIRFCAYKLQLSGGQDVEGIVGKHQGPGMDQLKEQLAKISDDKSKDQTLKTFVWRDKQFTIKNQSLAQSVIKAQDTRKSIQPNDASAFDAVLSAWAEADKLAKKALKDDKEATAKVTSSKSAKATEDLNNLFTFVEYNLFGSSIERNVCLVEQAVEKKPQYAVKLYDDILKNLEYIWELPQVKDDMSLDGELNVLSLYYKGCRCVQVASAYNEMKKTPESLAIYQRGQTYVVQAKQALSQIRSFAQDALLKVTDSDLADLEQAIRSGTWKSRATWYLENGSDSDEHVSEKMQQLDLNTTETLLEHLDSYPSSINPSHLVEFPPKFQPVACKPFYFDLAANFVKYPEESLAARTEKSSGSGSGFWGIFGRK